MSTVWGGGKKENLPLGGGESRRLSRWMASTVAGSVRAAAKNAVDLRGACLFNHSSDERCDCGMFVLAGASSAGK